MIDVLVVAHAPFTAINRRPYARLAARGWSIELVIPQRLPEMGSRDADPAADDDPKIHWVTVNRGNNRYWQFCGLTEIMNARRPKCIVLENEPDSAIARYVGLWAQDNDAKVVLISNENDLPSLSSSFIRGRAKPFARTARARIACLRSGKLIHHILSICSDGVDAMERLGFSGRVSKMPLGYEPDIFRPDPVARARVRTELSLVYPVVAYVGRMVKIKGVDILLDALERIDDLSWHLLIDDFHDSSDYGREIERRLQASEILSSRTVRFKAGHGEVANYMNGSDIVVAPSVWKEQYGRVVPEAMACGCAVVVSKAGALPELLGGCGLVVPAGDVAELARAIRNLIVDDAARAQFGNLAAQRAKDHLSLPVQVKEMENVLNRLNVTRAISPTGEVIK